jgi:predicted nucleic acid-binding protein
MTKLFLDTNIVVDLLERREPFCHDAVRLFTMAYNRQVQLVVSPMTFSTASFLLHKHGSEGVRNLLSNFRQLSRVAAANERTVDDSLASQFKDFEDAMQYYTALRAKADIIITRNGKDFVHSKLPVMTAGEFIATIE